MPRSGEEFDWRSWDAYVSRHASGGFMQSSAWIRCRAEAGYEHGTLILRDEVGEIAGGCVIGRWEWSAGSAFYYVQEGPLLPPDRELCGNVVSVLRQAWGQITTSDKGRVSHIRLEPRSPTDCALWCSQGFEVIDQEDAFCEPRHTRWIDLTRLEEHRLRDMKPKGRYNVHIARRHGVQVVEDNSNAAWSNFLAIRADMARRQGLVQRSRRHFDSIRAAFGKSARLFLAAHEGQVLAGALVLTFGGRATYLFGGSLNVHREVMAPYLLQHEIMNCLSGESMRTYDLWGLSPPSACGHTFDGFTKFKQKLGGVDLSLAPTLDWVIDPEAYEDFCKTSRLDANATSSQSMSYSASSFAQGRCAQGALLASASEQHRNSAS